jgi:integrase
MTTPATLAELDAIREAMPERFRAMILLAAWCGLRWGECVELRRTDLDLDAGTVTVARSVVRSENGPVVKSPKSRAGTRTVTIPAPIVPVLADHVERFAQVGPQGLIFPAPDGGHLAGASFTEHYYRARKLAGRPDLRFHDLRHTGQTLAAATGATLADLMARMGHATPAMAMRYMHASADRDRAIADALGSMIESNVVPLRKRA